VEGYKVTEQYFGKFSKQAYLAKIICPALRDGTYPEYSRFVGVFGIKNNNFCQSTDHILFMEDNRLIKKIFVYSFKTN